MDSFEKGNVFSYLNHSCEANTQLIQASLKLNEEVCCAGVVVKALKEIKELETLTINYFWSTSTEETKVYLDKSFPCFCGAKREAHSKFV